MAPGGLRGMRMRRLVECVPNFSEGRDAARIEAIAGAIRSAPGVRLLGVEPDRDYNRTVVTFVGEPEAVLEGAFRGIEMAARVIDMTSHAGNHPRIGAADVCPFVPVSGVTMDDCVTLAMSLGNRVWEEVGIPVYLYESAARIPQRRNLAEIRKGEYEGLAEKLRDPSWRPDYGPPEYNARSGAAIIGARPFLIAYNVNLDSASVGAASEIARTIRESGHIKDGARVPGTLRAVKAMGVLLSERNIAQVSMNLVDFRVTPPHVAFDECRRVAERLGERVRGSELVGLTPLEPMLLAGRHALGGAAADEGALVNAAIDYLGLSSLAPFYPQKKILELVLESG
jgi:glutamate formiminotransferase/formiminotetrahydrofolate cyclodeaminase